VCANNAAVTLTGSLRSANGIPAVNSVISFAPTNTGYIAGCGVNIASTFNCATSSDGSVVLLQNPLVTTTATPQYGSGSVPVGTYFVEYTFYDGNSHETLPSPEFTVSLTSAGTINVNAPSGGLQSSAVGMKVYIGTSSGAETYQGLTTGTASFAQSSALATSSVAPPTANSTICQVTANDAMWPVGTGYMVTLTDANGNQVPRFSQQWQLNGAGSTVNLSAGVPWYHGVVYYPSPIVSAPTNHGQQGISGPLSLNGYNLTNVGRLGIGTAFPAYPLHVVGDFNLQLGALRMNGVGGNLGQCLISSGASSTPTWGSCLTSTAVFYQTVEANGTPMTQRPNLNFSPAFTVTDDSGGADTKADLALQSGLAAGTYGQVTVNTQGIVTHASGFDQYIAVSGVNGITGCFTGGGSNPCTMTGTFSTAFVDTNYMVFCTPSTYGTGGSGGESGLLPNTVYGVEISSTTQFNIVVSAPGWAYSPGTMWCHGHHN
jgi:hypothetical protein